MSALNRVLRAIYSALVSLYCNKIIRFSTIFANFANAFLCKVLYCLNASHGQIVSWVTLYAKAPQSIQTLLHLLR